MMYIFKRLLRHLHEEQSVGAKGKNGISYIRRREFSKEAFVVVLKEVLLGFSY